MASRELAFDITANDKASAKVRGVQEAVQDLTKRVTEMFTATALFDRALGLAQQGLDYLFTTLKNSADLNDQAKAAGLTTAEFQRLGAAAQQAGLDQAGLMKGLKTMKEFLRDARVEGSKQAQVLRALGYSQDAVANGSVDAMDAMLRLSGAVEAARTPQEQYNIAASVFGARAQELIPLLDGLRTTMAQVSQEPIIGQQAIDNLDKAEKRMQRMKRFLDFLVTEGGGFALTPEGASTIANAIAPGTGIVARGAVMGQNILENKMLPGAVPVTKADREAAAALGKIGAGVTGSAQGLGNVSQAQSLGMATSVAIAQQQTAYLATIAANTSPSMGGVIPGNTNFTVPRDATAAELAATYAAIRTTTAPSSKVRPAR